MLQTAAAMTSKPVPPKLKKSARPFMPKDKEVCIARFLDGLRAGKTVMDAARGSGAGMATLKLWKKDNPEFASSWAEAYDEGTDVLEAEAQRRAVEGYDEVTETESVGPKGTTTTTTVVRKYSDTLLNIMLQGRRPDKFRKSNVELSGPGGGPIRAVMEIEFVEAPQKVKPK